MKINWKLRFKNSATCTSLALAVIAFVYQIFGIIGIVPAVSEDIATNVVAVIINIFTAFGILIDPTTKGIYDSERAMGYENPN